jgi:hypothetical protein
MIPHHSTFSENRLTISKASVGHDDAAGLSYRAGRMPVPVEDNSIINLIKCAGAA